jgi:adenine-specific DNA-methyltransferase
MVAKSEKDEVKQYVHADQKRVNNPPVGLVTAETDHMNGKKTYSFDPHLDPQLQWAGKTEGLSFDVDTVSLHVHERIDPLTIIEAVRKKEATEQTSLFHYFETKENNPPIREAIEFYKHSQGWSNRLIAGDSLLVMNSLIEKEGMAGKVQMIYIDPPYGVTYGSNFQPFVNNKDVKDGKDEDLTQEPEMVKAFRDTWELGIHSYLTYLRNRILLAHELLADNGSCFIQISDENTHHVREIMDEIFGPKNFVSQIFFKKTSGAGSPGELVQLASVGDYLLWYAKDFSKKKFRQLYAPKGLIEGGAEAYRLVKLPDGTIRPLTKEEASNPKLIGRDWKIFRIDNLTSQSGVEKTKYPVIINNKEYRPNKGVWKTSKEGMDQLIKVGRVHAGATSLGYVRYLEDFPAIQINNVWDDTTISGSSSKIYVVQTNQKVIDRCMLLTTDPGDLVLDITCGSGTTAQAAEQWGRRWITCDTSRVAIVLSKQRLMTAIFDYYKLAHTKEGVSSGFLYKTIPHITLKSIANNAPPEQETLYDQPEKDTNRVRVAGPFTVEAVPSQIVRSFEEVEKTSQEADISISRSGETLRQDDWISEMLSTGIRGKGGQVLEFARIEPLGGTRWVNASGETKNGKKVVISFGPEYAPLEQRQVELAIDETQQLVPKPNLVVFASFQFDPEASKDIDELKWPGVDVLKAQMNTDLLTADLKKKRASNESFWLMGQPDVELTRQANKYVITVNGFDYYNTKTGEIESGDTSKIAMWELDTDYDGRSLYPRQIFFPMAGSEEGWSKLAKNLKAQIDEELIENYRGNTSLPFKLGDNKQVAVKIIDDRGIESLKIIRVKE